MHISPLVYQDDDGDDDANRERVPLTPRDSNASSLSDDSSSLQSHRSANSYLQYFRSPPASRSRRNQQYHPEGEHHHHHPTAVSRTTPLHPVQEQQELDNVVDLDYAVPDSYQVNRERARRESFHSTPGSGRSSTSDNSSRRQSHNNNNGIMWSVSSASSYGSEQQHEHGDESSVAESRRSMRSSASHLFGEELLLQDDASSNNNNNTPDNYKPRDTDQGVFLAGDLEQGRPLESPSQVSDSTTDRPRGSSGHSLPVWMHDVADNWTSVLHHVQQDWQQVRQFTSRPVRHALPLSPRSKNLADLDYLVTTHKNKVQQMLKEEEAADSYDFCVVLQPQEVYAFWASLLDFRVEMLGPEMAESIVTDPTNNNGSSSTLELHKTSPSTDNTSPSSNGASSDEADSEVRDYLPAEITRTPLTGLYRRRNATHTLGGGDHVTPEPMIQGSAPRTAHSRVSQQPSPGLYSVTDNSVRARVSMFERAMGMTCSSATKMTLQRRQSTASSRSLLEDAAAAAGELTPNTVTSNRRRWGVHVTPGQHSTFSPMMPAARSTVPRRPTAVMRRDSPLQSSSDNNDNETDKQHPNSIRIQDIPNQVIPRGIAARTNGMLQFLSALKGGIVVRRHRPGQEAVFCKISSKDGGDTIQYETVEEQEAMNAFKEQRVRYNRASTDDGDADHQHASIPAQPWSMADGGGDNDENKQHNFSVPDYVAAKQYREKMIREKGLSKTVKDAVSKVVGSGSVKVCDIAAVHPAVHADPRSDSGDKGTTSLRRSKSEYSGANAFSLVLRSMQRFPRRHVASIDEYENKWYKSEGSESQFSYFDLETATEGEYWLIFRGFLLLHRDAVVGRFAEQRAQGVSSHYNRLEREQREQADLDAHNCLHKDEFHEPVTVGCLERLIVKMRDLDTTYMEGYTLPQARPPPSDYFLGFRSPGTQIWSRLRQAGFETQRVYSLDPRRVMIKIRCPSDRIMDVAEVLRLKLKTRDGTFAPFREDMMDIFRPLDDQLEFPPIHDKGDFMFRSSVRQNIIDFIIGSRYRDSGAELGSGLGNMLEARVPLHMPGKLDSILNGWVYYWRVDNWNGRDGKSMRVSTDESQSDDGTIDDSENEEVPNLYKRFTKGALYQPLDSIEQYFGEKIAFYFAWVQHTATHLVFLSVVGLFVFLLQVGTGEWDHWIRPYFATVIMLWTFVVLVNWRKRANFLAYRWGTMNYIEQETTRPQFRGEDHYDEITREWTLVYPKWKRWAKYAISFPLTLMFTCGSLIFILWVHANRDLQLANYLEQKADPNIKSFSWDFKISAIGKKNSIAIELSEEHLRDPRFWFITIGMPALLGLCLPLLNFILMKLSVMLNDFENYRTESEYRSYLIIKVFSFRFMCYFATLYYYCFISTGDPDSIQNGIFRVGTGVLVYTTVAHWWQIFVHVYFPILIRKIRMNHRRKRLCSELRDIELEEEEIIRLAERESDDDLKKRQVRVINKRLLLEQAQDSIWLEIMLPKHDSFPEYISAVVQFTFVSCFSVVFPLTPLICLFNYLLSMRLDAYKLCKGRRRPLAEKTGGIGVWEHLLNIVATISILTNCWLMGFTTASFAWIRDEVGGDGDAGGEVAFFAIIVGWEHLMLLIKYIMQSTISPLPKSVRDEMKREQFQVDQQRNLALQDRRSQYHREFGSSGGDYNLEHYNAWQPNVSMAASAKKVQQGLPTIPSQDSMDLDCENPPPSAPHEVALETVESGMSTRGTTSPVPSARQRPMTPPLHPDLERRLYSA